MALANLPRGQSTPQPPNGSNAASHPAITADSVWEYVSQTNMCREVRTAMQGNEFGPLLRLARPEDVSSSTVSRPKALLYDDGSPWCQP